MRTRDILPSNQRPPLRARLTQRLFEEMEGMYALGAATAMVVGLLLWDRAPQAWLILWLAYLLLCQLGLTLLTRAFYRGRLRPASDSLWVYLYSGGTLAAGLGWGTAVPLFYGFLDPYQTLVLMTVTLAVAAATLAPLSNQVLAYMISASATVLPGAATLLLRGRLDSMGAFGVLSLVVLVMFIRLAWREYRRRREDLDAAREAASLVEDLESERTQRYEAVTRLLRAANLDELTGLANEKHFHEQLARALQHGYRVIVCHLDLRGFMAVEDAYGQAAGEHMLRRVAERLREWSSTDGLAARLFGDHFAVFRRFGEDADEDVLMQEILDIIAMPVRWRDGEVSVRARAGVALAPAHGNRAEDLSARAESACRQSREHPDRTWLRFDPATTRELAGRSTKQLALGRAMERGELRVVYQPQVDTATGEVVGVEALLRWRHPQFGEVPPSEFIPMAEQAGLMDEIGGWVLSQCCRKTAAWAKELGRDFHVSVNMSMQQLASHRLMPLLDSVLQDTGLEPGRLQLEITEHALLVDVESSAEIIQQLREKGIGVTLDDFGTGAAALAFLGQVQLDRIKLDRPLVTGIGSNPRMARIAAALVQLARALDIEVSAEGVEDRDDLIRLREIGASQAQGFFLSRPVEANQVPALLGRRLVPEGARAGQGHGGSSG